MIFLLPLYMAGGILSAVLVNRFFVRRFSDEHRKTCTVITVVLFVFASGLLFLIHGAKVKVTDIVDQKALELTDYVVREYPEIPLVSEGYEVSRLNEALLEARSALPVSIAPNGGLPGKIADDVYKRIIDTVFNKVQDTLTGAEDFAENNRITFSSVVNGLKTQILYHLNRVVFYARMVLLAILFVYTVYCVCAGRKDQKRLALIP
jgi:hypothetical protein